MTIHSTRFCEKQVVVQNHYTGWQWSCQSTLSCVLLLCQFTPFVNNLFTRYMQGPYITSSPYRENWC